MDAFGVERAYGYASLFAGSRDPTPIRSNQIRCLRHTQRVVDASYSWTRGSVLLRSRAAGWPFVAIFPAWSAVMAVLSRLVLPPPPGACNMLHAARSGTAYDASRSLEMKILIAAVAWCILFVLCWPLALLVLVLWPIVWLFALPFRLVGITLSDMFAFMQALLFLPARALGWRPRQVQVRHTAAA